MAPALPRTVLALTAALALTACTTPGDSTTSQTPTGPLGEAASTPTPVPAPRQGTTTPPTATPAALDPCSLTWADLPAAVRPADPARPGQDIQPRPGEGFDTGCVYDNSTTPVDFAKPAQPGTFALRITVGTAFNPSKMTGATPKKWGATTGGLRPNPSSPSESCSAYTGLPGGPTVVVQTVNKRFPAADACTVTDAAMTALATP